MLAISLWCPQVHWQQGLRVGKLGHLTGEHHWLSYSGTSHPSLPSLLQGRRQLGLILELWDLGPTSRFCQVPDSWRCWESACGPPLYLATPWGCTYPVLWWGPLGSAPWLGLQGSPLLSTVPVHVLGGRLLHSLPPWPSSHPSPQPPSTKNFGCLEALWESRVGPVWLWSLLVIWAYVSSLVNVRETDPLSHPIYRD